ncbi:MAG: NAD+ synthase, partial [Bacteroidales bacterium]
MKIALAQINYHIGHFESNEKKVLAAIEKARAGNADLVVFSELAVSGYPPRDFLEFNDFVQRCLQSVERIARQCTGIAAIIGGPSPNNNPKGKRLFNTAFFLQDGQVISKHFKGLLPNYDVFDEYRYFEPSTIFETIDFHGKRLAITICEDLWNIGDDPLYRINPMDELNKQQPDLIINIAASPFHYLQSENRKKVLQQNVAKYKLPLFYVNHIGAQTELLFDGGSMVLNSAGIVVDELKYFKEDFKIFDVAEIESMEQSFDRPEPGKIALIYDALIMGIKNYFEKLGFKKAILGLSGGIDSAVTLVLAVRALNQENVRAVLLPSRHSSEHSIEDAVQLSKNLKIKYDIIPIEKTFQAFESTLNPLFGRIPADVTEENLQARIRGTILMALSNKHGFILLNTSNKSEAAVGYGTLYGDMNGGLSVLGDVYKTEVFELAEFINREKEIIP